MSQHDDDMPVIHKMRGRGALENPAGRFERIRLQSAPPEEESGPDVCRLDTQVFKDSNRTIISTNDSPDIGMEATVNPYRGCEHGCIYCYARPSHEYYGFSAGLDFETKIFAKTEAPRLLEEKLSAPGWQPKVITLSGITDPYQPLERSLKITRGCLEVLAAFRNPAVIITKNHLVTRDIDLLAELASYQAASVALSITTLDTELARLMEPRASTPERRFAAIEQLTKAGIPTRMMIGPVLPGLTEHEIPALLEKAAEKGAVNAHYTMLRLPYGVKDLFQTWIREHYPDRADRVLNRVRDMRNGKLNDPEFGTRMTGTGFYAEQVEQIFNLYKKRHGLDRDRSRLSTEHFRRDARSKQMSLF